MQQGSEAVEREKQLKEAERLYLNLRQVLAKQPGPKLQTELSKTQRALKQKEDKLKVGHLMYYLFNGLPILKEYIFKKREKYIHFCFGI